VFVERLSTHESLTLDIMSKVDADLNLTMTVNPEIKQRWYPLGIMKGYDQVIEPAHELISSVGRAKYLAPIYKALIHSDQLPLAEQWYKENTDFYHPYVVYQIGKMIDDAKKVAEEKKYTFLGINMKKAVESLYN